MRISRLEELFAQLSSHLPGWRSAELLEELRLLICHLRDVEREEEEDVDAADRRRRRRLQEAQLIAAWADSRAALQALRERLARERDEEDAGLGGLVEFVIEHLAVLLVVGASLVPSIKKSARDEGVALAGSEAWQGWLVGWLADQLVGGEPEPDGTSGVAPEPSLNPSPEPEAPGEGCDNGI